VKLKAILAIHRVAGPLALATVALFLLSTLLVELVGDAAGVAVVKRAIMFGLGWLGLVMAAAAGTGRALGARFRRTPALEAKARRMPFIMANGLLVLAPSAVVLDRLAQRGDFGPTFALLQVVELAAGATNLVLLALMARDGHAMARARRSAAEAADRARPGSSLVRVLSDAVSGPALARSASRRRGGRRASA
jgi:hypothetical protein